MYRYIYSECITDEGGVNEAERPQRNAWNVERRRSC